jgi:iron(II)-dependent oxidoreductase
MAIWKISDGRSGLFRGKSVVARGTPHLRGADDDPAVRELRDATRRMIDDGRYVFVLLKEAAEAVEEPCAGPAWAILEDQMALIPAGVVPVVQPDGSVEPVELEGFYFDRHAVSNEQYARFVVAGGYDDLETWPREAWPALPKFVDRTGRPGPRFWERGTYPPGLSDYPVVGVCWYEAVMFARWAGKRLPTAAERQKAAGWPDQLAGGACRRYPWGDVFAEGRANLWSAGLDRTAPVHDFREGATPNGLHQMAGNVWEWLDDPLDAIPCRPGEALSTWKPLRRIVGGAFDTYLPAEAANHFVTGQPDLDRRHNIGFRCAVSLGRLRERAD